MASTTFEALDRDWSALNRFEAAADVDVLLSNTSNSYAFFAITTQDTPPVIDPRRAHPLQPMSGRAMRLVSGERLWIAGANANAVIEV